MYKEIFVATVVEICDGDEFGKYLVADSAEELKTKIIDYVESEASERELKLVYDENKILEACKEGNDPDVNGADYIHVTNWDCYFVLFTKKIPVTIPENNKRTVFIVTKQYVDLNHGENTSRSKVFTTREQARKHLKECYDSTRSPGHINEPLVLPGMFYNRSDSELCDGDLEGNVTPDYIEVWDGSGCSFTGSVTEQEIEF